MQLLALLWLFDGRPAGCLCLWHASDPINLIRTNQRKGANEREGGNELQHGRQGRRQLPLLTYVGCNRVVELDSKSKGVEERERESGTK